MEHDAIVTVLKIDVAFKRFLFLSVLIGLLAVSSPWIVLRLLPDPYLWVIFSGSLVVPWAILQAIALRAHGWHALWLLISLPLIALWPVVSLFDSLVLERLKI